MEALEKAKLALRSHLLANKEKVSADLEIMRKKSEGNDVFVYAEKLAESLSFEDVLVYKEVFYKFSDNELENSYHLFQECMENKLYTPPPQKIFKRIKRALRFDQGLFFYNIALCWKQNKPLFHLNHSKL